MTKINSESATIYDDEAKKTGWLGPQVIFGLTFEYTRPGQTVLDLGIGTGLCAGLFYKAGLSVIGMDYSDEMIAVCRKKGCAISLLSHDLTRAPYPIPDGSVDHAVSSGVFPFIADLDVVFAETERVLRRDGMFSFTIADRSSQETPELTIGPENTGIDRSVTMYRQSEEQVVQLLTQHGFELTDSLRFTAYMSPERNEQVPIRAYLTQKRC